MAAIKIQNLEKTFGIRTIFKNVSFELKRGERLALIGANGAGKITRTEPLSFPTVKLSVI